VTTATADPVDGYAVATTGLKKTYGHTAALVGLDLAVPTGVVYGFLGANGAGKTTTIRCLLGLIHPDAGTMTLLGRPYTARDRRRLFDVGALIESPSFYPYLSGRDNLKVIAATGPEPAKGRVDEVLSLMGLSDRANSHTDEYSLGMRQRLGIAAALLHDPKLLILDEPANGLDPAGIHSLRAKLRDLADSGRTIMVSSHILPEVQQLADVVGIIDKGHLVHQGSLDELLKASGGVRVRLLPDEVERARAALARLEGPDVVSDSNGPGGELEEGHAWLAIKVPTERAAEVNRALAGAGIYASGIETRSDLEAIFLSLTTGDGT
jgi:ABC-2 type transport system ATP-binding protein